MATRFLTPFDLLTMSFKDREARGARDIFPEVRLGGGKAEKGILFGGGEIRAISSDSNGKEDRKISGQAIVFYDQNKPGTDYRWGDWDGWVVEERIATSALDASAMDDVVGLFNHDHNQILGRTKSGTMKLGRNAGGLSYEISLGDSSLANQVWDSVKRGDVRGSSFAFTVEEDSWTENKNEKKVIREIRKIKEVFDVGPVVWPAYTATSAEARSIIERIQGRSLETRQRNRKAMGVIIESLSGD